MGLFHSESFKSLLRASLSSQGIRPLAIEKHFDKFLKYLQDHMRVFTRERCKVEQFKVVKFFHILYK